MPSGAMETIAVYWEDRIKTYGLDEFSGLSWIRVNVSCEHLISWTDRFEELSVAGIRFHLVMIQPRDDHVLFHLLLDQCWEDKTSEWSNQRLNPRDRQSIRIVSPVELIHFHGPHFGERYGIADAACGCLADGNIPILVMGCSASSIYLVFQAGDLKKAQMALRRVFTTPIASFTRQPAANRKSRCPI
jgi:aspartokinase